MVTADAFRGMSTEAKFDHIWAQNDDLNARLNKALEELRLQGVEMKEHKERTHQDIEEWSRQINIKVNKLEEGTGEKKGEYRKMKDPCALKFHKDEKSEAVFQRWSFEFEGHIERLFPDKGEEYLRWARQKQETITKEDVLNKTIELGMPAGVDQILYSELRKFCNEGTPQLIMRKLNLGRHGSEAWRLMCDRYDPKGPIIAQALAENLSTLTWPKTSEAVVNMMDNIGVMVREYQDMTQEEYPEVTLRAKIMTIMPENYRSHINANAKQYSNFEKVKDFILEQIRLKREAEARKNIVNHKEKDGEANILDTMKQFKDEMLAAMWGSGQWGQQQQEYPQQEEEAPEGPPGFEALNALMGKGKGKGEKGGGKNNYKDYNYGQGKSGSTSYYMNNYNARGYQPKGFGKGNPLGGKGPGVKGSFPGVCYYCGLPGHRLNQCEKKTRDMRAGKGGGKAGANALDDDDDDAEGMNLLCEVCGDNEPGEINAAMDVENSGWEREPLMMDSGCSSSFLRNKALPRLKVNPPSKKDASRTWSTADGSIVKAMGASRVPFMTNQGEKKALNFKRSEKIQKNLGSVSEICDAGHMVMFSKNGGGIVKDVDEKIAKYLMSQAVGAIPFRREEGKGTYTLDMWVKKGSEENENNIKKPPVKKELEKEAEKEADDDEDVDMGELVVVEAEEWIEYLSKSQEKKNRKVIFQRQG